MAAKKHPSLSSLPHGWYDKDRALQEAYEENTGRQVSNLFDGEQWDYPPRLIKDREKFLQQLEVSSAPQGRTEGRSTGTDEVSAQEEPPCLVDVQA